MRFNLKEKTPSGSVKLYYKFVITILCITAKQLLYMNPVDIIFLVSSMVTEEIGATFRDIDRQPSSVISGLLLTYLSLDVSGIYLAVWSDSRSISGECCCRNQRFNSSSKTSKSVQKISFYSLVHF